MRKLSVNQIDAALAPILETVSDPEVPVLSVLDLGVILSATLDDTNHVHVVITPTYAGCPAMDVIRFEINRALELAGYPMVTIETVLSPAWTTDWITQNGKEKLKAYGIAPPVEKTTDKSFLTGKSKSVPCPRCGSMHTEMISLFGSTACKSLYRCEQCLEPFDYFKCH